MIIWAAIVERRVEANPGYVALVTAIAILVIAFFCGSAAGENTGSIVAAKVSVKTHRIEYRQSEEVIVTVTNNLEARITTFDQQASCSIIRLEQQIDERWTEVRDCFSGAPSQYVTLEPSSRTEVTLPSPRTGVYRAALVFSVGETFEFGESYISYSPQFAVR